MTAELGFGKWGGGIERMSRYFILFRFFFFDIYWKMYNGEQHSRTAYRPNQPASFSPMSKMQLDSNEMNI